MFGLLFLLCAFLSGCASAPKSIGDDPRPFDFHRDTFAYPNELVWEYGYDANGHWTTHRREPKPAYALHCFVLARSALQFYAHARFDPTRPVADEATYDRLIDRVVSSSPRTSAPEGDRIIIPGYSDLRHFSLAQEKLLKARCGGLYQCYFQRGNWRMIFPFSRKSQAHLADTLVARLKHNRPAILHLVRFPKLTINHAVLVFGAKPSTNTIDFISYDPNQPDKPLNLVYERATRTFFLPPNTYFPGGRVDAYEIYSRWDY